MLSYISTTGTWVIIGHGRIPPFHVLNSSSMSIFIYFEIFYIYSNWLSNKFTLLVTTLPETNPWKLVVGRWFISFWGKSFRGELALLVSFRESNIFPPFLQGGPTVRSRVITNPSYPFIRLFRPIYKASYKGPPCRWFSSPLASPQNTNKTPRYEALLQDH